MTNRVFWLILTVPFALLLALGATMIVLSDHRDNACEQAGGIPYRSICLDREAVIEP